MSNNIKVYLDNDPQIYLKVEEGTEEIEIAYSIIVISLETAQCMLKMITLFNQEIGGLHEEINKQKKLIDEKNCLTY